MAPYQFILALLHAHGLPEDRLTEAYHLILGRLAPGSEAWFTTPYPAEVGREAEITLLAAHGSSPLMKSVRQGALLEALTQAFGGDAIRADLTLRELCSAPWLN